MGESKTFIHKLAQHIQSHYDLSKQELTVVFPNKRAAFYLRNALKGNCKQTIWLPQIISIQEAVTQWSGIALADNIDLLFELIDIDAELHIEQDSDLNVFGSKAAQMAKDFDEIDQYGINAKSLFNYVLEHKKLGLWDFDTLKSKEKEQKYLKFFHSLHDYYLRLRDRLSKQDKGYYGMITRYLSELPETNLMAKIGDKSILFAGFNALTTTEERIIDTLIKNGKAEVIFDYDAYYVDDENNEAGLFARKYKLRHPKWLENGISDALSSEPKTIHIISANGDTVQAKALQAKLQESDDSNQAVILADEHLLIPVLNAIPDNDTYDSFKVSMGYPIAKTPVNQLIKEVFSLCRLKTITRTINDNNGLERKAEGLYLWPILHLMDLEIVKIVFPKAENTVFNRWKTKVVQSGKFIFEEKDIEDLAQCHGIQSFLRIILAEAWKKTHESILETIGALLAFLSQTLLARDDKESMNFLLNQLSETGKHISRLTNIVEHNAKYIKDIQSIEVLYRLLASNATVKLNSSDTEGLQIMGLLETRNLDFKRLHVLSVNEGMLPPDKPQGSFIPQFIRYACGLPGYAESQAVVAYHFYRLLQNGENIYLYYNSLDETFGGEASRFILQIKNELARNANITIEEESFNSVATPSLETRPLSAKKTEKTIERLHYLIGDEEEGLSPSSLSIYLACPLKYYFKYIADIQDNSIDEETGKDVIGKIIHGTLEFLFQEYLPKDGKLQMINKKLFDEIIKLQWEQKLAQSTAENTPNGFPDVGYNYLNHAIIEQQIKNYLNYISKVLETNTLAVLKTESKLKTHLQTSKGDFIVRGFADRIDQFDGHIRVIDYKTGHVDSSNLKVPVRHQSETDLDYLKQIPEKALQLLLYKYMYLKENPNIAPDQVTAAIHGLKYANNIEFNLAKANPTKNDTDADTAFLDDSTFIHDMESMLKAVIDEMLDTEIPFVQAEDDKKCGYCDFKLICKRE